MVLLLTATAIEGPYLPRECTRVNVPTLTRERT